MIYFCTIITANQAIFLQWNFCSLTVPALSNAVPILSLGVLNFLNGPLAILRTNITLKNPFGRFGTHKYRTEGVRDGKGQVKKNGSPLYRT